MRRERDQSAGPGHHIAGMLAMAYTKGTRAPGAENATGARRYACAMRRERDQSAGPGHHIAGMLAMAQRGPYDPSSGRGGTLRVHQRYGCAIRRERNQSAEPRCTQCRRHWREVLQLEPERRHWALQCRQSWWHWPALGNCSASRRLALEETGHSSASSSQDTGEPKEHPTPPFRHFSIANCSQITLNIARTPLEGNHDLISPQ